MRPTPVPSPTATPVNTRPVTGARVAVWMSAGVLGVAFGLNLGLPLPHPARSPRGMAQSNQAEVSVLLFPDLDGGGDFAADCTGCDGQFGSGDLFFAQRDPLPRLDVTLTDASGSRLTMRTRTLAPGRQQTSFRVDDAGTYTVTLASLPTEWQLCPNATHPHRVSTADFDASTHRAQLIVALTHGCRRPAVTAAPEATSTEHPAATQTVAAPAVPTAAATDVPPSESASGSNSGTRSDSAGADSDSAAEEDAPPPPSLEAISDAVPATPDGSMAADSVTADVFGTPSLPQTGRFGSTPFRPGTGFAWLAVSAAMLGAGGWRLQKRCLPQPPGRWPKWLR